MVDDPCETTAARMVFSILLGVQLNTFANFFLACEGAARWDKRIRLNVILMASSLSFLKRSPNVGQFFETFSRIGFFSILAKVLQLERN